eukprot:635454-Rhodomonas_salina.1
MAVCIVHHRRQDWRRHPTVDDVGGRGSRVASRLLVVEGQVSRVEGRWWRGRLVGRRSKVEGRKPSGQDRGLRVGRGSGVYGLEVEGLESRVEGHGWRVKVGGWWVEGGGPRVEGRGSGVEGLGSRVWGR